MTLYELNKTIYSGAPNLTDLEAATKQIEKFLKAHPGKYYMLLNNEEHYYTLFTFQDSVKFKPMSKEIMDIATELGNIKDIRENEEGAGLEFWIKYNNKITMFLLFNYDRGVVEV